MIINVLSKSLVRVKVERKQWTPPQIAPTSPNNHLFGGIVFQGGLVANNPLQPSCLATLGLVELQLAQTSSNPWIQTGPMYRKVILESGVFLPFLIFNLLLLQLMFGSCLQYFLQSFEIRLALRSCARLCGCVEMILSSKGLHLIHSCCLAG